MYPRDGAGTRVFSRKRLWNYSQGFFPDCLFAEGITDGALGARTVWFCRAVLCISAAYAVARCPSVCLSSRSCVLSKRVNILAKNFLPSGSHTILVVLYQTLWQYSDEDPLTAPPQKKKITIFEQYLALALITAVPSCVVNMSTVEYRLSHLYVVRLNKQLTPRHASVNRVYDRKPRQDNRTEFNCTRW